MLSIYIRALFPYAVFIDQYIKYCKNHQYKAYLDSNEGDYINAL